MFLYSFSRNPKMFSRGFSRKSKMFLYKTIPDTVSVHKHSVRDVKFLLICLSYNVILITGMGAAGTPTPTASAENEVPVMPTETAPVFPV